MCMVHCVYVSALFIFLFVCVWVPRLPMYVRNRYHKGHTALASITMQVHTSWLTGISLPLSHPPFTHTHTHTHTHMHTLSLVAKYVCLWTYRLHLCSWMCTILNWNNNRVFQTKGITMLCWLVINELSPLRTSDFKITYVISCYLSATYTYIFLGEWFT